MKNQRERMEFVSIMGQEGFNVDIAQKLMRASSTLHRLAEASCNGDWPADNGERKVEPCSRCESLWVRSSMKRLKDGQLLCKDCSTEDRVRQLCKPLDLEPIFQGDPRGAVLKVKVPSGRTNDMGREGICVP